MIQELLGAVVEAERKTTSQPQSQPTPENLRCPRCDSSNTKFCYYNNYNLTQPRHFCKTCRRYWTKGGALRNVPIGGGCRKAKAVASVIPSLANIGKIGAKPTRPMAGADFASAMGLVGPGGVHGYGSSYQNHDIIPSLWGSCGVPHSSHLLAQLLRASQQVQLHNPNLLSSFCEDGVKEERVMNGFQYQNQSLLLGDTPTSSGIQELYQRLQAPASCGNNESLQVFENNMTSSAMATTMTTSVVEPMPLMTGGEYGYWNPMATWTDLPTPNGAFL